MASPPVINLVSAWVVKFRAPELWVNVPELLSATPAVFSLFMKVVPLVAT